MPILIFLYCFVVSTIQARSSDESISLLLHTHKHAFVDPELIVLSGGKEQKIDLVGKDHKTDANLIVWSTENNLYISDDISMIQIRIVDQDKIHLSSIYRISPSQNTIYMYFDSKRDVGGFLSQNGFLPENEKLIQWWFLQRIACFTILALLCFWWMSQQDSQKTSKPKISLVYRWWYAPIFFGILAFLWQGSVFWQSNSDQLVGRHHDTLGTFWVIAQSPNWDSFFIDKQTGFPETSISYHDLDSFVLIALASFFSFLSPIVLYKILILSSLSLSAWAAEVWARKGFGVKEPWSYIAGIGYMFTGLSASAILEGHIYHLLQPWLPLTGLFWWRATRYGGTYKDSIATGIFFSLCLFTSSYVGLSCAILLVGIWIGNCGWRNPVTWLAIPTAIPAICTYSVLFSSSNMFLEREFFATLLGSTSLLNFWGAHSEIDRQGHSLSLGILLVPIILAICSNRYLTRVTGYRVLLATGLLSLILSFGPALSISSETELMYLPLYGIMQIPFLSAIGFPLRLAYPFMLCFSVVAAMTLQEVSRRYRWNHWFFVIVLFDVFGLQSLQNRQQLWNIQSPSAIQNGPVFEILPEISTQVKGSDPQLTLMMLGCLYQIQHQQPIAHNCVSTDIEHQNGILLQRDLYKNLAQRNNILQDLAEMGFQQFVVYPELFVKGDREIVLQALEKEGTLQQESFTPLWTRVYTYDPKKQQNDLFFEPTLEVLNISFLPLQSIDEQIWVQSEGTDVLLQIKKTGEKDVFVGELSEFSSGQQIKIHNGKGSVYWQGQVFVHADHQNIFVEEGIGIRYFAPILRSPPTTYNNTTVVFGSWLWCLGLSFFLWRRPKKQPSIQ